MALEGVNLILKWSVRRVLFTIQTLLKPLITDITTRGLSIPSKYHHFVGITRKDDLKWADECSVYLKSNGFIVPSRFGSLRVSPHVYNTPEEIKKLTALILHFDRNRNVDGKRRET